MHHLRFAAILLLALALAACQSAPQAPSSASDVKRAMAILTPPDSAGILVLPVTGAAGEGAPVTGSTRIPALSGGVRMAMARFTSLAEDGACGAL